MSNHTAYLNHVQDKRHIKVNTVEYDQWLEKLLDFDTTGLEIDYLWVDCEIYWLYMAAQGTSEWKEARKGRVTGSVLAEACKKGKYSNTTDQKLYDINQIDMHDIMKVQIDQNIVSQEIAGIKAKMFGDFAITAMAHGTKTEPLIRKHHSDRVGLTILELPIAVPKFNPNLGVSIDAYLKNEPNRKYYNCIGEYKAPQYLYKDLQNRLILQQNGLSNQNYDHIVKNHYYQMHLGMRIFQKDFCDYIAYDCVFMKQAYFERIPFNTKFWEIEIEKPVNNFIDQYLKPQLNSTSSSPYPMMPRY